MKLLGIRFWEEELSPWRKAVTVKFFGWCRTFHYGRSVYAEYIGGGHHRWVTLREFLRRKARSR